VKKNIWLLEVEAGREGIKNLCLQNIIFSPANGLEQGNREASMQSHDHQPLSSFYWPTVLDIPVTIYETMLSQMSPSTQLALSPLLPTPHRQAGVKCSLSLKKNAIRENENAPLWFLLFNILKINREQIVVQVATVPTQLGAQWPCLHAFE